MRLCYICVGGFGHVLPYLDCFKRAGHDVHFIALSPAPEYGVQTYNVGFGMRYSQTRGKFKYVASMLQARRLVKKLRPDIVHTHYATSGGLAGLVCGFYPTIVTAHGTDLSVGHRSLVWKPLLRAIFKHAALVNTVSDDLKEKAIDLGVDPEKIFVLTPGISTSEFSFAHRPVITRNRALRLVTTRRLEYLYDHPTIVRALGILRSKCVDFRMTFVAGGSLLESLKRQVEKEGLTDHVKFLGGVEKSDIITILHDNDVFLSSPLWDGISLALLEAMATGLFPIVSDLKVNSSWVQNGVGGFLHSVGDARALVDCILKVYDDPCFIKKAAERNRRKVVESGDTEKNMKVLEGIYRELMQKRR